MSHFIGDPLDWEELSYTRHPFSLAGCPLGPCFHSLARRPFLHSFDFACRTFFLVLVLSCTLSSTQPLK